MVRRIVIEMDVEEGTDTTLVQDITNLVMCRMDGDVEFTIRQEILPERRQIKVPAFMLPSGNRGRSYRKGCVENG